MKSLYEHMTCTKECSVGTLQVALTPPLAGSSAVEVTSPVELCWGTALCKMWQAVPTPCFVDLQKAWGKVASDVNTCFSQIRVVQRALNLNFWRSLEFDVHLQIYFILFVKILLFKVTLFIFTITFLFLEWQLLKPALE